MDGFLSEMNRYWLGDKKMLEYKRKETSQVVVLSNGGYLAVDRQRIKTSFCFGYSTDYSGHEHSDAEKARQAFLKSGEAFKEQNLHEIDALIRALKSEPENRRDYYYGTIPMISSSYYPNRNGYVPNVFQIRWVRWWDEEIQRQEADGYVKLEGEDLALVISAYEAERESFNKRLDTYLKKYGTKKLKTWTYWMDA